MVIMADNCTHDCSTCSEKCESRDPNAFRVAANPNSNVRKVIGVVSGKGGVGKSLVTSLLAAGVSRSGKSAGILDADLTGPSIPRMFGVEDAEVIGMESGLLPVESSGNVKIMSINLLLENREDPVIWRGPVIAGTVKQFWSDVIWGDLDYLFVDMPPGTGDVPLTVFQSLPVDGIVIVSTPQDLVSMIVGKAVRMASTLNIPVLGLVENMSYVSCPDCGKKIEVFGKSGTFEVAEKYGIPKTARLPILPELASFCDSGRIEEAPDNVIRDVASILED